ncbi:MAG: hypothetical protein PHC64_00910 [Candidatus Gastranaerophilales bacterium]|nr:hypothetical protein [Candidatus Gastranaerophilales bacterium]
MGCLKNIFKAIILVFAVIGFMSLGGKDFFIKKWNEIVHPPQDIMLERAKKVGDFSKVGEEYEIDKAASALGYNGVLAEHKASGQKMIVVDSGKKILLLPQDFKDKTVDKKLQDLTEKFKYQFVNLQDLKITKKGFINTFNKKAPYVRFEAKANKLPVGEIKGIVSAVETSSGEVKVLVSVNEKEKYSQLIAEDFFKKVKE